MIVTLRKHFLLPAFLPSFIHSFTHYYNLSTLGRHYSSYLLRAGLTKGLSPSFWSAGIGVSRPDHSSCVHHCRGDPRKSHSHSSPQQRIPNGYGRGRMMHETSKALKVYPSATSFSSIYPLYFPPLFMATCLRSWASSPTTSCISVAPQPETSF